jgi:hypothetical protein
MKYPQVHILDSIAWGPYKVSLREDGIMQVEIEPEQEVTIDNVKEIIEAIGKLGNRNKYPVLVLPGEYTLPTPEARLFIASPGNPYALAEAYLTHSLPQKLVGNFFLQFNKPERPTRMFSKYEEALEWLNSISG